MLGFPLQKDGYELVPALNGREALDRFADGGIDLVILDLMMPGIDGLEVCRRLRARSGVPIIILTARDDESSKVAGLEMGADDYITKPFSLREFRSRVRAALRRSMMAPTFDGQEPIRSHDLEIDLARRSVSVRGEQVKLTYVEFEVLVAMARHPGRVFTREALLEAVWGSSEYRDTRTIDVHIRHLREKLERDPAHPEYLFTVRGAGYGFREG
ncbi:response regulator transcription factor [Thermoleophilia bacterium SCSIO 60948]|nr:response regulator transcription factor [Thermoleophilia bacterium SCSIO 60948]